MTVAGANEAGHSVFPAAESSAVDAHSLSDTKRSSAMSEDVPPSNCARS